MKGLKKHSLLLATATLSTVTFAELVPMSDHLLSETTGQAGITIDVNASLITIGEVDYQDEGFLALKDIALTDSDLVSAMDNVRVTLDVAGDGSDLGANGLGGQAILNSGGAITNLNEVDQNTAVSDGDLIISIRAIDDSLPLDYGLSVGSIELGASTSEIGNVNGGTVLVNNLNLTGNLGPIDIVIDNGNQGMNLNVFANVEGEVELPFIGTSLSFALHNNRGASTVVLGSQTFAHFQMNMGQGTTIDGQEAMAVDINDFSGDMDLTNIQLGNNGQSIGDLYITDLQLSAETLTYGH